MSMDRTNAEYHRPLIYRDREDSPVPELDSYLPFGLRRDDGSSQDPDNRFRVCRDNPVNIYGGI